MYKELLQLLKKKNLKQNKKTKDLNRCFLKEDM